MKCSNCGFDNPAAAKFCGKCGNALAARPQPQKPNQGKPPEQEQPRPQKPGRSQPPAQEQPQVLHQTINVQAPGYGYIQVPAEFQPIGAWSYFFMNIIFLIPVLGFITALILALGGTKNVHLRNFARSRFCTLIIFSVIGLAVLAIMVGTLR